MPDVLLVAQHDAHATPTLNDAVVDDDAIKCVVFTGVGNVFSAGFDLSEFTRAADDDEFGRQLWASSDRFHDTVSPRQGLADAATEVVERVCAAPREVLVRIKAKALRRAGFHAESPTLDL